MRHDTQHNSILHNESQHNDVQHNNKKCDTQHNDNQHDRLNAYAVCCYAEDAELNPICCVSL